MTPIMLATQLLKVLFEQGSHLDDPIRHSLDLAEPLFVEGRIIEDLRCNSSAVNGRIRIQRSHQYLDLRVNPLLLFGGLASD